MTHALQISLAVLTLAACGGTQANRSEAPRESSSPAYTTSSSAPAGQHVMPDGTTMAGPEHINHSSGQHVIPDGTVMTGHEHLAPAAGQHIMPDGGTMQGHHHEEGASHVMPDGTVMGGATHGEKP